MKFSKKYRHVGYSYPGVPKGWIKIVEETVIRLEKEMWPRWIPLFIKRWIHYLATGNSVVRVKSRLWNKIRNRLTNGQIIFDIKDKFATLRIYGSFNDICDKIIEEAEKRCDKTCEKCGSTSNIETVNLGWVFNLCPDCTEVERINRQK